MQTEVGVNRESVIFLLMDSAANELSILGSTQSSESERVPAVLGLDIIPGRAVFVKVVIATSPALCSPRGLLRIC